MFIINKKTNPASFQETGLSCDKGKNGTINTGNF